MHLFAEISEKKNEDSNTTVSVIDFYNQHYKITEKFHLCIVKFVCLFMIALIRYRHENIK